MYFAFALSKFTNQSVAGLRKSLWPNDSSVLVLEFICNLRTAMHVATLSWEASIELNALQQNDQN